jgi:lysophospholipase L1-like esterase
VKPDSFFAPQKTLAFLGSVGMICAVLMGVIPEEGIPIYGDHRLVFARFDDFKPKEKIGIDDAAAFLANYDAVIAEEDSIPEPVEEEINWGERFIAPENAEMQDPELQAEFRERMRIHHGEGGIKNLDLFFASARNLSETQAKLRVMHYGDSQIEADRITRTLRNALQKRFGGEGPGLVHAVEVVPTAAIKQSASSNWKRYTVFGRQDTSLTHNRFGVLGAFGKNDSLTSELRFSPSNMAHDRARSFSEVTLYYGNYSTASQLSVYVNDSLYKTAELPSDSLPKTYRFRVKSRNAEVKLVFEGGPVECYALAFDGVAGIQVDNIPMRGSSGTIFRKMDHRTLAAQWRALDPGLILLQYGGNSVPYVADTAAAQNYGKWMRSQITLIQEILPEAAIIFIGPSDMATKEKDEFVTFPYLEVVRDELKAAALSTGCGYWDIYEVMGGRNSMAAWVAADPPLAGADYIHFTPKGAQRVGDIFVKALFDAAKEQERTHESEGKK